LNDDSAHFPPVDAVTAGMRGRCPRCGEGALFDGFLTPAPSCRHCGLDLSFADAGDGPAIFIMLIIGFVVVGLALWIEVVHSPPLWLHFLLWVPLSLALCLGALRPLKGVMIALQYKNDAAEGRIDDGR
jgi:uncharacterized protein (DUF983 family)